jgi:uncharacterized protein (DUF433 family)
MDEMTMLDTSPVTTAIATMIRAGTTEAALLAAVAAAYPTLTPSELSVALQVAQTQAEKRAARPH